MHKPIAEMAAYLQTLLPPAIPPTFDIDPMFLGELTAAEIQCGVPAFRVFLHQLYDRLAAEATPFDKPVRTSHNVNINSSYPFILQLTVMLINIGIYSKFNSIDALTAPNKMSLQKIPDKRKRECVQFLTNCGFCFSEAGGITITYPSNPAMLAGLKVMAAAQHALGTKYIAEILLRCDWRALANKKTDAQPVLMDLIHSLPADIRHFVLNLHTDYMRHGYKCDTYIGINTRYEYFCRSKELWRFNLTPDNGHFITIKAQNTDKYPEIVAQLPARLQADIAKGYGCGKKMGITDGCDSGCRGYRVPLDGSFMKISGVLKAWLEKEVAIMRK